MTYRGHYIITRTAACGKRHQSFSLFPKASGRENRISALSALWSICRLLPQSTSQVAQRPAATPRACSQTVACDLDGFQLLVPEYCTHCPRHHFDNPAARGSIDTVHTVSPHKSTSMNQKRASFIWRDRTNVDEATTRSQQSTAD